MKMVGMAATAKPVIRRRSGPCVSKSDQPRSGAHAINSATIASMAEVGKND
jgi:hypothetical protein